MTSEDLARSFGMRVEDVEDVLASKESAEEVAQRLGLSATVADALTSSRAPRKATKKKGG
jgi:hypothetical protein